MKSARRLKNSTNFQNRAFQSVFEHQILLTDRKWQSSWNWATECLPLIVICAIIVIWVIIRPLKITDTSRDARFFYERKPFCAKINDSLDSRAFFSHSWDKWMYPSKKKGWSETSVSWHHTASVYVHQLLYNCVPQARPQKRSDWQRKEEKVQVKRRKNFIDISRANVLWMY